MSTCNQFDLGILGYRLVNAKKSLGHWFRHPTRNECMGWCAQIALEVLMGFLELCTLVYG